MHIANSDRPVQFYSLDVIISVGYRVKSQHGNEFIKNVGDIFMGRQRATYVNDFAE